MDEKQQPTTSLDAVDVVWLKKDVRLHDHAPLSRIVSSSRSCIIMYLYEPDQLSEKTVHGSHVAFVNEGLVDLDLRLSGRDCLAKANKNDIDVYKHRFQCLTVCYAGAVYTLRTLHRRRCIHQLLCHMETSHLKSFARDKAVRRWCRSNNIPVMEFNQTGVTRCLSNRDDFKANFNKFLDRPMQETPNELQLKDMRRRLIDTDAKGIMLHGRCNKPMRPADILEISMEHRYDRTHRQYGGEAEALRMFDSFLSRRGANYSSGISSPNTSWTTGSRLSPYLTWGHISLRYVIVMTKTRQEECRVAKMALAAPSPWQRSLASFQSRMHWRSHFMQKLEMQPNLEEQDQCLAFSHLRRQPDDFCQLYFDAWCQGRTGFPFVDACMRCLIQTGWLNFRMRAMLVSFATYNLWLDWKTIAGHLARVFLDYEPGIHYPQLQMQAGTTGINAMRVYNVTKQGKDQDPDGCFIRKYLPELRNVPNQYIHEPSSMPQSVQKKYGVSVSNREIQNGSAVVWSTFEPVKQPTDEQEEAGLNNIAQYPLPIVDEKSSARIAKEKLAAVRKLESTKLEAKKVFLKHGSRSKNRDCARLKAVDRTAKRVKVDNGQTSLLRCWKSPFPEEPLKCERLLKHSVVQHDAIHKPPPFSIGNGNKFKFSATITSPMTQFLAQKTVSDTPMGKATCWSCTKCTFLNEKPLALVCSMCGSLRQ